MSLCSLVPPKQAHAIYGYTEFGIGGAMIKNGATFFGDPAMSPTIGYAEALNYGAYLQIFDTQLIDVDFGAKFQSARGGSQAQIAGLYPNLRFNFPRFYVGAGYSPLYFKGTQYVDLQMRTATGLSAELGLLWKIVPFFYLNLQGAAQFVTAGGPSPWPTYELTLQFRFNMWTKASEPGKESKHKYDGFRYPWGIMK